AVATGLWPPVAKRPPVFHPVLDPVLRLVGIDGLGVGDQRRDEQMVMAATALLLGRNVAAVALAHPAPIAIEGRRGVRAGAARDGRHAPAVADAVMLAPFALIPVWPLAQALQRLRSGDDGAGFL